MEGTLIAEVASRHGGFQPLFNVDYSKAKTGWNIARVPLSGIDCSDFIQIGLRGSTGSVGRHIHVDNLVVHDPAQHDLSAIGIVSSDKIKVGTEAAVTASLINIGTERVDGYEVEIWANGAFLQSLPGVPLEPLETAGFDFDIMPSVAMSRNVSFGVKIIYNEDENPANNILIGKSVSVEMPNYPSVQDLSGSYGDGNVSLEWSALGDCVLDPEPVTDNFECYEEFAD